MVLPLDKPPGWTMHDGKSAGRGVAVALVAEGSNAEKAGVRPGWKIRTIGGGEMHTAADVDAAWKEAMRKQESHILIEFQGMRGEGAPQCIHLNPMEEPGFQGLKWEMSPHMPPVKEVRRVERLGPLALDQCLQSTQPPSPPASHDPLTPT